MKRTLLTVFTLIVSLLVSDARPYDLTSQRISTADGLPTNIVNRIWQDSTGYIWIETANGLCRYDGYRVTQIDDSVRRISTRSEVLKTHDAEWIRKGNGRLERRDRNGIRRNWQLIPEDVIAYTHNDHFQVADIDGKTEAISTYGGGLWLYDKSAGEITQLTTANSGGIIGNDYLTNLFVDDTGCVWVTEDYLGVKCIRLNRLAFRHFPVVAKTDVQEENHIRCLSRMKNGHLLVATQTGMVYDFNPTDGQSKLYQKMKSRVYAVLEDSKGSLWLGTRGGGLFKDNRNIEGLPSSHIYSMVEDIKGNMWIAMLNGGVACRNADETLRTFLAGKNCHDIIADAKNRWWVAAEDSLYTIENGKVVPITAGYFLCMFRDSNDVLWAGSMGRGLIRIRKGDVQHIQTGNGLANNTVYAITEDHHGSLWIGTEEGLSRLDAVTGDVESFIIGNGKLINVFNERTAVCLDDGRLAFGTHDGVVMIEPEQTAYEKGQRERIRAPQTLITGIQANDEAVRTDHVRHDQNNLTFQFSNLEYATLNSVLYQYWLEGYDNEWCPPTKEHAATYRHLPPGRYVFHVRSNNGMGKWGEETAYEFTIHQPWWNTWWAWFFYLVVSAATVVTVWRTSRRIMSLHRQIEVERRVSAFKKDFYDRIERELRNPVNVLQGATENVQLSGTSKTTVQSLRRGSKRMLRLMDMIRQFHKLSDVEIQVKSEAEVINEDTEQRFRQIVSSIHAEEAEYREMAPPPINEHTILVIEEDEDNLTHLTDTLNSYFRIIGLQRMEDCETMVATHQPSLVIIDISSNKKGGNDLTSRLHESHPTLPIIHLSSDSDDVHQLRSLRSGASDYIVKPFSGKVLVERVRKALEYSTLSGTMAEPTEKTGVLTDVKDKKFLDRLKNMLSAHIGDENFSVEQWADMMKLGRTQFYKRVKDLTGETPVQHLQRARLEYAARLLQETDATVEEIMVRAGYHNATHFYNSFKKKFGMSPKAYRSVMI